PRLTQVWPSSWRRAFSWFTVASEPCGAFSRAGHTGTGRPDKPLGRKDWHRRESEANTGVQQWAGLERLSIPRHQQQPARLLKPFVRETGRHHRAGDRGDALVVKQDQAVRPVGRALAVPSWPQRSRATWLTRSSRCSGKSLPGHRFLPVREAVSVRESSSPP